MGNFEASNIRVQDLDHSGIIAGICDEMGLVEQIDKRLGTHPQEIIIVTLRSSILVDSIDIDRI
jgi:Domain of unknown function (DUF4277)